MNNVIVKEIKNAVVSVVGAVALWATLFQVSFLILPQYFGSYWFAKILANSALFFGGYIFVAFYMVLAREKGMIWSPINMLAALASPYVSFHSLNPQSPLSFFFIHTNSVIQRDTKKYFPLIRDLTLVLIKLALITEIYMLILEQENTSSLMRTLLMR